MIPHFLYISMRRIIQTSRQTSCTPDGIVGDHSDLMEFEEKAWAKCYSLPQIPINKHNVVEITPQK